MYYGFTELYKTKRGNPCARCVPSLPKLKLKVRSHTPSLPIWPNNLSCNLFAKYRQPAVCNLLKKNLSQKVLCKVYNLNLLLFMRGWVCGRPYCRPSSAGLGMHREQGFS